MTDHDDSDTEAAPTGQATPPITDLPSALNAETPEAGSPEEAVEADSPPPRSWYVQAGNLAFLGMLVVLILFPPLAALFRSGGSKQVGPEEKPRTTVPVNALPSAPSAAIQTPAAVAPTPGLSAYGEKFLSLMSEGGLDCTDNSGAEQCKKQIVSYAHQICSYSGQPIDLVYRHIGLPAFLGPREERRAIESAEQAYPNCTFTGRP